MPTVRNSGKLTVCTNTISIGRENVSVVSNHVIIWDLRSEPLENFEA